jgi:hypothetical protein
MQYVKESQGNPSTGLLLNLYSKVVEVHGPSIIISAISRNDTITNRIPIY